MQKKEGINHQTKEWERHQRTRTRSGCLICGVGGFFNRYRFNGEQVLCLLVHASKKYFYTESCQLRCLENLCLLLLKTEKKSENSKFFFTLPKFFDIPPGKQNNP